MKEISVYFPSSSCALCNVPVPKGYPQSQTHTGVVNYNGTILLTASPYPNIHRRKINNYIRAGFRKLSGGILFREKRAEYYENPFLYSSEDGLNFSLLQSQPLMAPLDPYYGYPAFNSDPDIFMEDDRVYVINRCIYRTKLTPGRHRDEYDIRLFLIEGLMDGGRFKYLKTALFYETTDLIVSPCLTKYKDEYIFSMLYTNCYNDGRSFDALKIARVKSIDGLNNVQNFNIVNVEGGDYLPWHMSLFVYGDKMYSIIACIKKNEPGRCYQMLGEFNADLSQLIIYQTPLTDFNSYRGAAYVSNDGEFHLYSTTVNEHIKGGKSVDGREIICTHCPFQALIMQSKGLKI